MASLSTEVPGAPYGIWIFVDSWESLRGFEGNHVIQRVCTMGQAGTLRPAGHIYLPLLRFVSNVVSVQATSVHLHTVAVFAQQLSDCDRDHVACRA